MSKARSHRRRAYMRLPIHELAASLDSRRHRSERRATSRISLALSPCLAFQVERPLLAPIVRVGLRPQSGAHRLFVGPSTKGRSGSIVFSNGSRGEALLWFRRLGMPVFSARSLALDGVSWVQGGEVENAVGR